MAMRSSRRWVTRIPGTLYRIDPAISGEPRIPGTLYRIDPASLASQGRESGTRIGYSVPGITQQFFDGGGDVGGGGGGSVAPEAAHSAVPAATLHAACLPCRIIWQVWRALRGSPTRAKPPASSPHRIPQAGRSNQPTTIAGRHYSGHALDQMRARGIPPSVVDNTIRTGIRSPGNTPGTFRYYDPTNDISVITNSRGGVITVRGGN